MFNSIHEECGVFGVYSPSEQIPAAALTYSALYALQHRGQESCGIAVNDDGVIFAHKDAGLVGDVFTKDILASLGGTHTAAVGHCRYATTGSEMRVNAQPLVVNHVKGSMALCHNGNLTNAYGLRKELELEGAIFHTTNDTEVISYIITKERLSAPSIEQAVNAAMERIKGAYSLVIMSPSKLIAVRDPYGYRPLCIGKLKSPSGSVSYVFASESCALDAVGAELVRDVEPGEIVIADESGLRSITDHVGKCERGMCVFEYIYFARPDSILDGSSVHTARLRAGTFLALEHPVQADVVVGVPDSGLDAALGFSQQSGIPYGLGFIKNKYIARTFIQPTQSSREDKVRIKLNPVRRTVEGKRVVLIDDSIVRGTTSARIVQLLRDAGAREVHMRVAAPPFLFPCFFGTDIDDKSKLIANNHTIDEIAEIIGVDSLGYLSTDHVVKLCDSPPKSGGKGCGFCTGCFTGVYPSEVPTHTSKNKFAHRKSEHVE